MSKDKDDEKDVITIFDSISKPFNDLKTGLHFFDFFEQLERRSFLFSNVEKYPALSKILRNDNYFLKDNSLSRLVNSSTAWETAIKQQAALQIPSRINKLLEGFRINPNILEIFSDSATNFDRINRINDQLRAKHLFLTALSLDEYEKELDQESEQSSLIHDVTKQIKHVNWIPIHLFERICRDPNLMHGLSGRDFEYVVAEIFYELGFLNIFVTPQSDDGGRDITATTIENGVPIYVAIECKRYKNKIGPTHLRSLLGTISLDNTRADKGILVTSSTFTRRSKEIILSAAPIYGKDFNDLVFDLNNISRRKGFK